MQLVDLYILFIDLQFVIFELKALYLEASAKLRILDLIFK